MRIIALEEHIVTGDVLNAWRNLPVSEQDPALRPSSEGESGRLLLELGGERLAAMDAAGVDVQVLSLTTPGVQNLERSKAVDLALATNDLLSLAIGQSPSRFQGFACLPTPDAQHAARELERAVLELGLHGAMVFGRTGEKNFDHTDYWPIFEAASALRAPLYMHPQTPQTGVRKALYSGLGARVDSLLQSAGIGWHYEAGVQTIRMALAGVFDRFPDLQIITGHFGEVMLFYLDRIDMMSGPAKLTRKVSEYIREHVSVTPSGLFSQRYLRWAIEVLGADRVMMSTDYPFVPTAPRAATSFLAASGLTEQVQTRIASGNWDRMVAAIRR